MEHGYYQTFLLLTIIASTMQLLLESPVHSQVRCSFHILSIPIFQLTSTSKRTNVTFISWLFEYNALLAWRQSIVTEQTGLILDCIFLVIFFTEFLLKTLLHGIYWWKALLFLISNKNVSTTNTFWGSTCAFSLAVTRTLKWFGIMLRSIAA